MKKVSCALIDSSKSPSVIPTERKSKPLVISSLDFFYALIWRGHSCRCWADVEEILDDAKIEIDAEGIGRQCNPTARHAVGEHRTYGFWNGILLLIV